MRDEIWRASTEAKFTQIYTEITCQHYKRVSKYVDIFTIVFSGGGTLMGFAFWKSGALMPVIACGLTMIVQVIKHVSPKLFPSDKDYKKLNDVIQFFFSQHHELTKLWHEYDKEEINEKIARERYFKIIEKEKTILNAMNEVLSDDNKRRIKKAEEATHILFKQ